VEVDVYERWARAQARRAFPDLPARESQDATAGVIRVKRDPALRMAIEALCEPRRPHAAKPRTSRKPKPLARRKDLLDLFGDRALLEVVLRNSTQSLGAHVLGEVLEHTHVQFSRTSEEEYAHVDRKRLVTVDGRPIDAGTPLEDAGSVDAEDYAVLFELARRRAEQRGVPPTAPRLYDCLVLDEAQEFAALELALIGRSLAPAGSLVVAGDADQQTDASACFTSWEDSLRELGQSDYERAVLPVSYRCPPAVVAIARQLTGAAANERAATSRDASGAEPGSASASTPSAVPFVQFLNECHLGVWLVSELKELRQKDPNASVAVICRRALTARRLYGALHHANLGRLVADGDFSFRAGVNVTHVDQVKGLEFDYVIVPDASPATYPDTADARRALYVAVTRARHQLVLGAVAGQSPLLLLP
jgi:DNA helicase-2/ATP-dependent DNA helicase PcrA